MKKSIFFDIIILGSGPAGCAAGLIFKESGYSVAIIENDIDQAISVGENLQADAKELLFRLQFSESLLNEVHLPACETASLWDSYLPVVKYSLFNPYGHGWHLDKKKFTKQLLEKCISKGVDYLHGSHLEIEHQQYGGWEITCRHIKSAIFSSAFLVDCTGRNRILLRKLSVPVVRYDSLIAINAVFTVQSLELPSTAFIESVEHGWWYSAAIPDNKRIVSLFTNAKSEFFKGSIKYLNFLNEMSATQLLRPYMTCFKSYQFLPLRIRYANSEISSSFFGPDWICAGDAAATFDPLSSQGIGTALKMGIEAATAVCDFMKSGHRIKLELFTETYKDFFQNYLHQRKQHYGQVKKWPHSQFWLSNANNSMPPLKTTYNATTKSGKI